MQWIKEWCEELAWCWKRRVRAANRSVAHLGRFQANLESEAPVALSDVGSLEWSVICSISVSQMLSSIPLRPPPTVTSWWPIG